MYRTVTYIVCTHLHAQVRSHCAVRTHSILAHKTAHVITQENGHSRYGHTDTYGQSTYGHSRYGQSTYEHSMYGQSKYGHTDTYGRSTYHASNLLSSLGSAAMWSQ